MSYKPKNFFDKVYRDKNGKVVIAQSPNIPIYGAILFAVLSQIFTKGKLNVGFESLQYAFIFTWAYLEFRYPDAIIRRVLGILVLLLIGFSYFL